MKVLALTRYGRRGASSRLRTLQFLPGLASAGIDVVAEPLLDDAFLARRYAGKPVDLAALVRAYASRAARLIRGGSWDLVWLEKEAFPWLPGPLENALARYGAPVMAEYDDAWFHRYDGHASAAVRALLGGKIDAIMRRSSMVVAGNPYLAERARRAGARRVEVVPTCVDTARYDGSPAASTSLPFTVGWIGTPLTARYLAGIAPALKRLAEEGPLRLLAIGLDRLDIDGVPCSVLPWSEETEGRALSGIDVGVMPLPDSPWERGKCGYKLLQCMAAARPVVASPVGVNASIVTEGEDGYLAADEAGWLRALGSLRADPAARRVMGEHGRRKVEERYSVAANLPRLAGLLREAARA